MLTIQKLTTMLELQDKLNCEINPEWRSANYPWHRAVMVEAIEALDHFGWKWWKKQEPDLEQVRLELADIWHFILSMRLSTCGGDIEWAAVSLTSSFSAIPASMIATPRKFDMLISGAADGVIDTSALLGLMRDVGLSWDGLYTVYVEKNVLNHFRLGHGYQAGSYRKDWGGVEDNVVLAQLMKQKPDATPAQLYHKLEQVYAERVLSVATV